MRIAGFAEHIAPPEASELAMEKPDEAMFSGTERGIAKGAMQAKLVYRANVRERVLREDKALAAVDRGDGMNWNGNSVAAGIFGNMTGSQTPRLEFFVIPFAVDFPEVVFAVTSPAEIDDAQVTRLFAGTGVNFR